MFKFSVGSLGAFPIFDDHVSRKGLVEERTDQNLGPRDKYTVYMGHC